MKVISFAKYSFLYIKSILRKVSLSQRLRTLFVFLLALLFVLALSIEGYAQVRRAAVIRDVTFGDGDINSFQIIRVPNGQREPISTISREQRRIDEGGGLSIPNDGTSLASIYFERQTENGREEDYGGLLITTRPDRRTKPPTTNYKYPCAFSGQLIIAWPSSSRARTCDNGEDGRIEIIEDPLSLLSSIQSSELALKSAPALGTKQKSSEQYPENLFVSPGSGATVFRTTSSPYTKDEFVTERCDRDFGGDYCQRIITLQRERISIEVLEGDILVQSKQSPEGERVDEGQRYSYPSQEVENFDVSGAAMSCETLRFLNAAYWSSPETSQNIIDSITEQVKQHRDALGISGRLPTNLSVLEQGIVEELRLARTDPDAYADLLEDQKEYFYRNYLNLPGETVDSNTRINAVSEAIQMFRSQSWLPSLSISVGMSRANRDHITDQGRDGKFAGHTGANSSGAGERIRRYGIVGCPPSYEDDDFENIVYFDQSTHQGVVPTSRAVVMEMLITYRPRRTGKPSNIFNPDHQVAGISCGRHSDFLPDMCVVTFANGYLEN